MIPWCSFYTIIWFLDPVMQEMKNVIVDPGNVLQGEVPDSVRVWNDPYSVATDRLYNLNSFKEYKRDFSKLKFKDQVALVSKIVEQNFI